MEVYFAIQNTFIKYFAGIGPTDLYGTRVPLPVRALYQAGLWLYSIEQYCGLSPTHLWCHYKSDEPLFIAVKERQY